MYHGNDPGNDGSASSTVTTVITINPIIVATAGAGGSISPSGTTTVTYGSNQSYTIIPNAGFSISSLKVDNSAVATSTSYIFTSVIANHTIDAEFSQNPVATTTYLLTATTTGSGTGTITSGDHAINCGSAGSACSSTYNASTTVTLTASANTPTSTFAGWGGDCSAAGTSSTCTVTMTGAKNVTAQFDLASETLAVGTQGSGGGTVSSTPGSIFCDSANPSSTCTGVFTIGNAVTLFAAPNASSTFSNWSGGACNNSTSTTCSVTIDSATSNSTILAVFDLIPPPTQSAVNLTIAGTGSGEVSSTPSGIDCTAAGTCTANFTIGATTTLTAAADASSTFTGWSGDECSGSTSTTCSFTVPSSTVSITAAFDTANNGGGTPTSTPSSTVPATADLMITKIADVTSTTPGGAVNYTLTVSALGPGTSTGVTATDILPATLDFISANPSKGTYSSRTGVWTIGDLAPSSTATLVIDTTVDASTTASTTIANVATVAEGASSTDPDMGNNSSTASIFVNATSTNNGGGGGCTSNCGGGGTPSSTPSSTVDLAITNVVDNANPATSTNVNYLITVTNNGNATGTFIEMDDAWPSTAFAFVGATTSVASPSITGTGLSWNIGTLAPNATATLELELNVGANQAGQTIANTATVTSTLASFSDPTPGNNSSTANITVQSAATSTNNGGGNGGGGGGGGGGITVGVAGGGGGGGNGGVVLGASTTTLPTGSTAPQGQVLGASTTCGFYLTSYIKPANYKNVDNNSAQVKLLQEFLNAELGTAIPVTGYYGSLSEAAVRQFQLKYSTEVLAPWVPYGLANDKTSTGYVYKTTQRWINMIECPALALPMPQLP